VNEAPTRPGTEAGTAIYVYGIVRSDTPADAFDEVRGVDATSPISLLREGDLAAVTGSVALSEFGEAALAENLRNPQWLEEKVRAHDRVLEAACENGTVLPFRFGAIYRGEQQVRSLLAERRDFLQTLARLDGAVELGVKAFLDRTALHDRLGRGRGLADEPASGGRAYMERRQLERELEEEVRRLAAEAAADSHERLSAAALEGRLSPLPRPELSSEEGEIVLNAAYLVRRDEGDRLREAVAELERSAEGDIRYRVTGPWPPYNFVEEADS
jgi:Gas vesicle synthesis protein GvpL/GvpF